HTAGEECGLLQVKIVAVEKEQRYPRQVEPKRPAVTKINCGDGKHATSQASPGYGIFFSLFPQSILWQHFQFRRRNSRMLAGIIPEVPDPRCCPSQTDYSEDDERSPPSYQRNQPSDQRRC